MAEGMRYTPLRVPEGLIAICVDEETGDETEIPIVSLVIDELGQILAGAWSEKQKRFHIDVTDSLFFPGFSTIAFATDDEEEDEPMEDDLDLDTDA